MADIVNLLSSMFGGAQQQSPVGPAYTPQPSAGVPVPQPNPMRSSMQPQPTQGPGWGQKLGDAFSGMAQVDPTATAMSAFSQGFSGSRASQKTRADEEAAKAAAAADRRREDRQQEFENQLKRDDARRKEISSKFTNLKTAADIEKLQREAASNGVSPKEYADLEDRMNNYREVLAGKYGELFVNRDDAEGNQRGQEEMFSVIETMVDAERQRQLELLRNASSGGGGAGGKVPQGTEQNPFQPYSEEQLNGLPSGAIYVNPADGQLYRKR